MAIAMTWEFCFAIQGSGKGIAAVALIVLYLKVLYKKKVVFSEKWMLCSSHLIFPLFPAKFGHRVAMR